MAFIKFIIGISVFVALMYGFVMYIKWSSDLNMPGVRDRPWYTAPKYMSDSYQNLYFWALYYWERWTPI